MNATFSRSLGAVALVSVVLSSSAAANAPAGRYTMTGGTVLDRPGREVCLGGSQDLLPDPEPRGHRLAPSDEEGARDHRRPFAVEPVD
jgi:hypothetical protein